MTTDNYEMGLASRIHAESDSTRRNQLIDELHLLCLKGHAFDQLAELLQLHDDDDVRAALFIAGELGDRASPVVALMESFLKKDDSYFLGDACSVVLNSAGAAHGGVAALCIALLTRADDRRRELGINFLIRSRDETLQSGVDAMRASQLLPELCSFIDLALGSSRQDKKLPSNEHSSSLEQAFRLIDPCRRVIKLSRLRPRRAHPVARADVQLIQACAKTDDPVIREYAQTILELYCQHVA